MSMLWFASCSVSPPVFHNAPLPLSMVLLSQGGVLCICILFQTPKQVITTNKMTSGFSKHEHKESGDVTNKPGETSNATLYKSVSMGLLHWKKGSVRLKGFFKFLSLSSSPSPLSSLLSKLYHCPPVNCSKFGWTVSYKCQNLGQLNERKFSLTEVWSPPCLPSNNIKGLGLLHLGWNLSYCMSSLFQK